MLVIQVRDVSAAKQVELFFPPYALILEVKNATAESFPGTLSKGNISLVYCGRILNDFDSLQDALSKERNSLGTPLIHAICINKGVDPDPVGNNDSNIATQTAAGESSEQSRTETGGEMDNTFSDIAFDSLSLQRAREQLTAGEVVLQSTQRHIEDVCALAAECSVSEKSMILTDTPEGAGETGDPQQELPRPRWIDIRLIIRIVVSLFIFCRDWDWESLYTVGMVGLFYYCLNTGIIRYLYRLSYRLYRGPQHRGAGVGGRGPGDDARQQVQPGEQAQGAAPEVPANVRPAVVGVAAVQDWVIGGFYVPANDAVDAQRATGGALEGQPLPPQRTLVAWLTMKLVDILSLIVGFVMSLFPTWTVDGINIPW